MYTYNYNMVRTLSIVTVIITHRANHDNNAVYYIPYIYIYVHIYIYIRVCIHLCR